LNFDFDHRKPSSSRITRLILGIVIAVAACGAASGVTAYMLTKGRTE